MTSWAKNYASMASLKQEADVVVAGTITGIAAVNNDAASGPGVLSTEYIFEVDQIVWDPQRRLSSASIFIHQVGGRSGDMGCEVAGIPLFTLGERALLFLKLYEPGGADHYTPFGGHPAAHYTIVNGFVHPMPDSSIKFDTLQTEDEFIARIQNA